ncbi:MAG: hypothetical protein AAGF98_19820, partial [Cyanobacteria bacterium P01_H01_bin.153]
VRNGLLLDAERWQVAHDYHRQRQNLHYQALHLPGIVCGLEVKVTSSPEDVSARYRDGRWLRVDPGVAIDAQGNLIVVDKPVKVHLASLTEAEPHWVYLVVRYVDPESLQQPPPAEIIAESFRIDEKKHTGPLDVEICRILLPPDGAPLAPAENVFQPAVGELDLRHRQPAQLRPQATVRVAYVKTGLDAEDQRIHRSLSALLDATMALYPPLQAETEVTAINLSEVPDELLSASAEAADRLLPEMMQSDLLYLTHRQCLSLSKAAAKCLTHQLDRGAVVVVELPSRDGNFEEMSAIIHELETAVEDLQGSQRFSDLRSQLTAELNAVTADLEGRLATAQQSLLQQLFPDGIAEPLQEPHEAHPLRQKPFAFSQWPILRQEPPQLYEGGGIVLMMGDVSQAWAASATLKLSRDRVRAAQELGINLLQFAYDRHHRTQIQASSSN